MHDKEKWGKGHDHGKHKGHKCERSFFLNFPTERTADEDEMLVGPGRQNCPTGGDLRMLMYSKKAWKSDSKRWFMCEDNDDDDDKGNKYGMNMCGPNAPNLWAFLGMIEKKKEYAKKYKRSKSDEERDEKRERESVCWRQSLNVSPPGSASKKGHYKNMPTTIAALLALWNRCIAASQAMEKAIAEGSSMNPADILLAIGLNKDSRGECIPESFT